MRIVFILYVLASHYCIGQNLIEKANALFQKRDFISVKEMLSSIKKTENHFAEAQYLLGRVATEERKYLQAVNYFENATQARPTIAEYHNWLGVLYGVVAMDSNPIKQAFLAPKIKNEFETAAGIEPNNIQTQWGLLYYYVKAPGFLGGSWEKAKQSVAVIDKLNHGQGLAAKGFIHENQGDKIKAKTFYEQSAKICPGFKETEDGLKRLR